MFNALVGLVFLLMVGTVYGEEFRTHDPLKAFVYGEYSLGDDYFIKGTVDTQLFRCILTKETDGFEGVALSEVSIWGYRGPWEIFRKEPTGSYLYTGTDHLRSTACLESCQSNTYLRTGQCQWRRGWPQQ